MRGTKAVCIALQLAPFWLWGVLLPGVSAQGLVPVPDTMTHELNAYYISKLGVDFAYYSILTGRNVLGTNAFNLVNGIRDDADPLTAASKTSTMRGFYESNGIGGKVMVDVFYKFVRCAAPPNCIDLERVLITSSRDPSGPQELLTVSKGIIPKTGWLINANQSAVSAVLGQPNTVEREYKDQVFNAQLFYKVVAPPPPCSSANPQIELGAIGEFEDLPQLGCIDYQGYTMLLATDTLTGINVIRDYGTSAERCDGSLAVYYTSDIASGIGPNIIALLRTPNAVPTTLRMVLPYGLGCTDIDYSDPEIVLQAAAYLSQEDPFSPGPAYSTLTLPTPSTIKGLGFVDTCAPFLYAAYYGAFLTGNSNDIAEAFPGNQTFTNSLVKHDGAEVCVSAIGTNAEDDRDANEDACAQLYFGNADQQREGLVTYYELNSTTSAPDPLQSFEFAQDCKDRYQLKVENILPQVAIDFEADKAFLLSSTEVKIHMDAVAANAASIVALEIALASSGIVVARTIARSGLYRRQRLSSSMARIIACLTTAFAITIFNVPNFALITKSLQNHNGKRTFTTATARMYKPSNFSSVLMAETHSFVTVQGSSATAVIGLILYLVALFFSLYVTWGEFTEIIKRKNEAARCLGHEALVADKHLLIEWRGTDSKLHDILHPGAVKETGLAADIELMRRAVARKQMEGGDPQGGSSPRNYPGGLESPRQQYRGPAMV